LTVSVSPLPSFSTATAAVAAASGRRSSGGGNGLSFTSLVGNAARLNAKHSQSQTSLGTGVSLGPAGMFGGASNRAAAAMGQARRPSSAHGSSAGDRDGVGEQQGLEGQSSSAAGVGSSLWQQGPLRSVSGGLAGAPTGTVCCLLVLQFTILALDRYVDAL
jgi:hypothetical protein